jgi:hypothetical protein
MMDRATSLGPSFVEQCRERLFWRHLLGRGHKDGPLFFVL